MLSIGEAVAAVFVMAFVIIFCRAAPFLFFQKLGAHRRERFIGFVERAVPPVAMTVLAISAVASTIKADNGTAVPSLLAVALAVSLHILKRNVLVSIGVSTLGYMLFCRINIL